MYTDEDLDSAVKAGILTKDSAAAFRAHVGLLANAAAVDEEHFRLVTGFNDIFVVIACALLLASVAWMGALIATWLGALAAAIAAWALAEFFVRRRRMALPAIVLLLAFVGSVFGVGALFVARMNGTLALASALAAAAAWLHWLRFRVPITVAAGAAAVAGFLAAAVLATIPEAANWIAGISFIAGIAVFFLAMRWDMADRRRETRKSDVAFWLHLLAAPLIVRPVFSALGVLDGEADLWQASAVVALYVAIALVSLAIDRRALMVSALVYVLYTFAALLSQYGGVSLSFAVTGFIIGSALLLLSAFWHRSRGFVLSRLPEGVQQRLAPSR
jgi:hypothetical protein